MRLSLKTLFGLCALVLLTGFGLKACNRVPPSALEPVTLEWWSVYLNDADVVPMLQAFHQKHPTISVNFRKLSFDEYEEELIDAFAEDRGPDLFSIHNTWIGKYQSKLRPMPPTITLPIQYIAGSIKKEVVTELVTERGSRPSDVTARFLEVVADDVVRVGQENPALPPKEEVYGLPLSVDTMVMYANRDLLNANRLPAPARTWSEFQEHVRRLTRLDSATILQSGGALGAVGNIPRVADLIALLMMQNGTEMTDAGGGAAFQTIPPALAGERGVLPGEEALRFYTDFANPIKDVYTWNETLPNALEMFASGRLGYFFGYAYDAPIIKARAPRLRLTVAPIPQIEGNPEVHFANYWVETVARKSAHPQEAWGLIQFMTSDEQARGYVERSGLPPALRILIPVFAEDPKLGVFTLQLLTSKSWYRGMNPSAAEQAITDMITMIQSGEQTFAEALNFAAGRVNQTL